MILLELVKEIGIDPSRVASTHGGEYHSACPTCGGKDRFIIQPNRQQKNCVGYYKCRQCNMSGDTIQFCREFLLLSFEEAIKKAHAHVSGIYNQIKAYGPNRFIPSHLNKPTLIWLHKARLFVDWAHKHIFEHDDVLRWLSSRGLPLEAVKKYKIGWCPKRLVQPRISWGVEIKNHEGCSIESLKLHKGIVIPTVEKNAEVVRVKIRRSEWKQGDKLPKYFALPGSMNGLNIIGSTDREVMVVVEAELDAFSIDYSSGDLVFVVAVGSNMKNPDIVTDYLARTKKCLLVCYDNDEGGLAMWKKWSGLYAHARPCPTPIGKDIGEACALGLNLRNWVKDKLRESFKW